MSTVVIGLSLGMLLFLLAAGLTLIFGMLGVINFAHGAIYMIGAYVSFEIGKRTGSFLLGVTAATFTTALIGAVVERFTLRPIYGRPHFYQLVLTFGLILVISDVVRYFWGSGYQEVSIPPLWSGTLSLLGSTIPVYRLFVIGMGIVASVLLYFFLEKSTFGMLVRAASSDAEMVRILGLPVGQIRMAVFSIGCALSGLSGAIAAPLFPVELGMASNTIIDCFVVIILGGLGNVRGTILASLMVGMVRALGYVYLPSWVDILTFTLLIVTLLTRPQGLFFRAARLA